MTGPGTFASLKMRLNGRWRWLRPHSACGRLAVESAIHVRGKRARQRSTGAAGGARAPRNLRALRETAGDKLAAARLLGIGKTTLYRKLNNTSQNGRKPERCKPRDKTPQIVSIKIQLAADDRLGNLLGRTIEHPHVHCFLIPRRFMSTAPVAVLLVLNVLMFIGGYFLFDKAHRHSDSVLFSVLFLCSGMPALIYQIGLAARSFFPFTE